MELYQLAPEPLSLMMSYVIKTDGGKIIIIDGGIDGHGKWNKTYIEAAVRAILDLSDGDYFEIEAWFLTHIHMDHYLELGKLLNGYNDASNFKINNIYFDFPPLREAVDGWESPAGPNDSKEEELRYFKDALSHYAEVTGEERFTYQRLNGSIINRENIEKGLTLTIDDVSFEFFDTWQRDAKCVNSTSIIFKAVSKGKSLLFVGDTYIDNGDRALERYGAGALKADYIQLGHHGQNGPSERFYKALIDDNTVRLWPTPVWVWSVYNAQNGIKTDVTRGWLGLPQNYEGLTNTKKDIVAGLYEKFPEDPSKTECWTKEILSEQRIF